jgi:transposase
MFARIKKNTNTNKRTVLVCHNVRFGNCVRQQTVKVFGHSANSSELQGLFNEAKNWIAEHGVQYMAQYEKLKVPKRMNQKVMVTNLKEESRINVGIEDIFGKLYREMGFHELLSKTHQETLRQIIFARLLEPSSKRRLSFVSEKDFDKEIPLDRIYRMMDKLTKESTHVENKIFSATEKAVGGKISLMLFDVTTLSFETISEDVLRAFGFSKDFKFNTTQVVLALATTQEGLPVGYRLFPGNTAESKTLIESINAWRKHMPIDEVTIVGDRAMMSEENLSLLESAGFYYVIAFPLRKLPQKEQASILDMNTYTAVRCDNEINCYKVIEKNGKRIISTYSKKRSEKDRKDRERLIKKLEKKLQTCKDAKRLINNKSYLKFAEIEGKATAKIDEEKILKDARWDGLHGVITNKPIIGCEIYEEYRRLWVIEESFRINKYNLKMRPIYHFTPHRIQAHILICYMVFTLIRHLQFQLKKRSQPMSAFRIIDALRDVQASIMRDVVTEARYKMLSRLTEDAEIIYDTLQLERGFSTLQLE